MYEATFQENFDLNTLCNVFIWTRKSKVCLKLDLFQLEFMHYKSKNCHKVHEPKKDFVV